MKVGDRVVTITVGDIVPEGTVGTIEDTGDLPGLGFVFFVDVGDGGGPYPFEPKDLKETT